MRRWLSFGYVFSFANGALPSAYFQFAKSTIVTW
jgi:hypothetical protein